MINSLTRSEDILGLDVAFMRLMSLRPPLAVAIHDRLYSLPHFIMATQGRE